LKDGTSVQMPQSNTINPLNGQSVMPSAAVTRPAIGSVATDAGATVPHTEQEMSVKEQIEKAVKAELEKRHKNNVGTFDNIHIESTAKTLADEWMKQYHRNQERTDNPRNIGNQAMSALGATIATPFDWMFRK